MTVAEFDWLDGLEKPASESDPLHRVRSLTPERYGWVTATPQGASAFDNQCNECGHDGNTRHSTEKGLDGRMRPSKRTPIRCTQCGLPLPRPSMVDKKTGRRRIISAHLNSYGRMRGDRPALTLKQNFIGFESGMHLHPTQHRTLSPREALAVHTVSKYGYDWGDAGTKQVASAIGESVPPLFFEMLARHLVIVTGV